MVKEKAVVITAEVQSKGEVHATEIVVKRHSVPEYGEKRFFTRHERYEGTRKLGNRGQSV